MSRWCCRSSRTSRGDDSRPLDGVALTLTPSPASSPRKPSYPKSGEPALAPSIGYDLSLERGDFPPHTVPFESDAFAGAVFVARRADKAMDAATHRAFFKGKSRTIQVQWRVALKRSLRGPLFLGFESGPGCLVDADALPSSATVATMVAVLRMFHSSDDMHLFLPHGDEQWNGRGDWAVGVHCKNALCGFVATPEGEEPPPLDSPMAEAARLPPWSTLRVGPTYSFCFYSQYMDLFGHTLCNLPMLGTYTLPVHTLRVVLYESTASVAGAIAEKKGAPYGLASAPAEAPDDDALPGDPRRTHAFSVVLSRRR